MKHWRDYLKSGAHLSDYFTTPHVVRGFYTSLNGTEVLVRIEVKHHDHTGGEIMGFDGVDDYDHSYALKGNVEENSIDDPTLQAMLRHLWNIAEEQLNDPEAEKKINLLPCRKGNEKPIRA
jgi:hypothetical protein